MPSIDERVVIMKFENDTFESKLGETIASLDKLRESLDFSASKQSLKDLNDAGNRFDISHMASGVEAIASKFTALGAIGFSVIQKLTQSFMGFAGDMVNMAKTDILGPIITGGRQRALNIEQAQFMFRGLGIDVQAGMDSALNAVRGTAFGLDEAAKAAAQFGASGIKVGDDMTGALRGVAGAAAMTGSSFTEIADIFAGVAGTGKLTNQDLMQFATRGLNAAAALGKQMGKSEAQIHDMATNGEIDFATFAKAMDEAFGKHSQEANQTYAGSLANVHAAMSRLGAAFIAPKLTQMRDIFNALSPVIDNVTASMKPVIAVFTWFGAIGSQKVVDFLNKLDFSNVNLAMPNFAAAIANAFQGVGQIVNTVKEAFRDIFPKQEVSVLVQFSEAVKAFSEHLKMGGETIDKVKSIFRGFFSVIDIGWTILKEIVHLIAGLISSISPAGGKLLDVAAAGGDFLTKMDQLLVKGGGIHNFFIKLGEVVQTPVTYINALRDRLVELWDAFTGKGGAGPAVAEQGLARVNSRFQQLKDTADKLGNIWDGLKQRLQGITDVFDQVWAYIKDWFASLGQKIAAAFQPGDFNSAVDIINVGLLGGIAIMLNKFLKGDFLKNLGGGIVDKLNGILGGITNTLKTMQQEIKAKALLQIAEALAVLTASIVVLSLIDSAALTKALAAITVGMAQLMGMLVAMDKLIGGTGDSAKLAILGASLIEISTAIGILSLAVAGMSRLSWEEIGRGLAGVTGALVMMSIAAVILNTEGSGGMILVGAGMIAIATGLTILAGAVKLFATLSWADMGKGLAGIAGGIILVAAGMNAMPATSVISGLGFIEVAIGLNILYTAVKLFSGLGWAEMLKGMVGIGAGLLIIAGAMQLMPLTLPITALGLIMVAGALNVMAGAIILMGKQDLGTLAKGVGALAAMMLILALGVNAMNGALPGAAALVIVAGALTILGNVIKSLGEIKTGDLIKGMIAIAGVLAILGVAALVMEPIIPALMGLGVAIALVGAGFTLFGLGAYFVARALQAMAESGVAGAKAFVESIKIMITAIPDIVKAVGQAILGSSEELLAAVPLLVRLITAILDQLLTTIIQLLPKLLVVIGMLIGGILKLIRDHFPEYVQTGFEMLMALLHGIEDNIGEIVNTVVNIITNFISALTDRIPDLAQAMYDFLIALATEVAYRAGELQTAFIPIGEAFIQGLWDGIQQNLPIVVDFFTTLVPKVLGWVGDVLSTLWQKGTDLIQGLWNGLTGKIGDVMSFFTSLPGNIIGWIGDVLGLLLSKGWDVIQGLWNGLIQKQNELAGWLMGIGGRIFGWVGDLFRTLYGTGWDLLVGLSQGAENKLAEIMHWMQGFGGMIFGWVGDISRTLWDTGWDCINGLWEGMKGAWDDVTGWLSDLNPVSWFNDIAPKPGHADTNLLGIGREVMLGLKSGMEDGWGDVTTWLSSLNPAEHVADPTDVANKFQKSLTNLANTLPNTAEFNPVISPVLDLTNVKAQAKELNTLVPTGVISPTLSVANAQVIAATGQVGQPIPVEPVSQGPQTINFEQNIYSPDPLSTSDIYRATKSQIVLAKEELGIS